MTYSLQAFSSEQVLNAAQINQTEVSIRDHVHGIGGVSDNLFDSFYADVDQTLASGSLHIIHGMASSRVSGEFSVVNSSQLSSDHAGWYDVHIKVLMTTADSSFTPALECYKNNDANPIFQMRKYMSDGSSGINYSDFGSVYLDGGSDYITFKMSGQSSGSVIQHSIENTFIDIFRVY